MNGKRLLLLLFAVIPAGAFAQASAVAQTNPIDTAYHACLSEPNNYTDAAMISCTRTAAAAWNAELERDYASLLSKLPADGKKSLEAAQKAWVAYRDAEAAFSTTLFERDMQGTMWVVTNAGRYYDIVRSRALDLEGYLSTLN